MPMMLGVLPFGLIAGVSAASVGLPVLEAILMSAIVFAGASQLVGLQLMALGSSVLVILTATFFVNLRMMMYSLSLVALFKYVTMPMRVLMAYLMTDQAYAYSINRFGLADASPNGHWYYLGIAVPLWVLWMVTTVIGVLLGAQLPEAWSLDFAIPLTFMALLFPAIKTKPMVTAAVVGGTVVFWHTVSPTTWGLSALRFWAFWPGYSATRKAAHHEPY
jgi:4-azaleucine resistance transporter AzlC